MSPLLLGLQVIPRFTQGLFYSGFMESLAMVHRYAKFFQSVHEDATDDRERLQEQQNFQAQDQAQKRIQRLEAWLRSQGIDPNNRLKL